MASTAAYRRQMGLYFALPVVWGCLEAFALPGWSSLGFLVCALFLEERIGRRMAFQALVFAGWTAWLGSPLRPDASGRIDPFKSALSGVPRSGDWIPVEGTVDGFPSRKRKLLFAIVTEHGAYRVTSTDTGFPVVPGQRLRIEARPAPPSPPTNPGQFDYPAYLRSQDLDGILEARSLTSIGRPGAFDRLIAYLRASLEATLDRSVPPAQAPLLKAAMLGATDDLDPGLVEDFKSSGMLHILAISGQHVGIFALILLQVFALLRLPRKAAFLATGAALALYVPICGNQISVLRAAIMFWACLPAVVWERPAFGVNSLGWAATGILAWMPHQILSLGFQLSFAATFLLILYSRPMAQGLARMRVRKALPVYLVSTSALSLVIFLGVYPVLAALVHTAAPSSILGNLVTVGISSGMIVSACLTLLAGPISPLAACFGETAGGLGALLSASVHRLAHWPGSSLSVAALPLAWSLALLFLVFAFPYAARIRKGLMFALLGACAFSGRWAWGEAWRAWDRPVSIAFLDVGQGDGTLCRLPGADILIDAGPPEAGRNVILPYLRSQGVNRLDIVLITHPDLDHYGGLAYVASHLSIGKVIHPGLDADTQAWRDLKAVLAEKGVPMVTAFRGQGLYAGKDAAMSVLSPERPGQYADRNDNSVVARLDLRGRAFLFTGDMGHLPESALMALGADRLRGAILKVPHHGSDLSSTREFLEAVRPPVAVFSAGRNNRFGHPGPVTVAALEEMGSRIFLTARDGAVTFAYHGRGEAGGIGKVGASREAWSSYLRLPEGMDGHAGIDSARGHRKGSKRKNVH